jgi:hypothetical protein
MQDTIAMMSVKCESYLRKSIPRDKAVLVSISCVYYPELLAKWIRAASQVDVRRMHTFVGILLLQLQNYLNVGTLVCVRLETL